MKRKAAWLFIATITLGLSSLLFQASHAEGARQGNVGGDSSSAQAVDQGNRAAHSHPGITVDSTPQSYGVQSLFAGASGSDLNTIFATAAPMPAVHSVAGPHSQLVCTLTCPLNISTSNDPGQCGAVVNYARPTEGMDPCGAIVCSPASGSFFPVGTTTVTCSATLDMATCTFTVTVNDSAPPTITCPSPVVQENDLNQCGAVVTYPPPTVSDNCPNVGSPMCSPSSGSFFPVGTTTVTCTVSDAASNSANCTFTVTVHDTQVPLITCPANIFQPNDPNQCGAVVTYPPPTVSDNCPSVGSPTCSPSSGSFFPVGTTTITCRVSDDTDCENIFAVDTSNNLVIFRASTPGSVDSLPIAVLGTEEVLAIDFRPATGQLYGLIQDTATMMLRLVTINVADGGTSAVGVPFSASGTNFGFDFNPTVDRIRITSDAETNISANPDTGAITVQSPLNPGNPNVVGSAYTNNFVGATTTLLYAIDSGTDTLATQNPPANGTLTTVGNLNVLTSDLVGFDISQCGAAYAVLNVGGVSGLYTIDLTFGMATLAGSVGGPNQIRAMSVETSRTAQCTFTVTVNDTQPPMITCPANQMADAAPESPGATVNFPPPTAADNCPGVTTMCSPASGSTFAPGTTQVNCTATDASGNTAGCSFQVNVTCTPDPSLNNTNPLVISRFRANGPGGANDEFVEIHNPLPSPHVVSAANCTAGYSVFASAGNGTTSNAVQQVCRIPNGTVIPAGGYFLCTGSSYTLDQLGRNSGPAGATSTGDAPIGCGGTCLGNIPDDAGLALLDVGANIVTACPKGAFACPTGFNYSSGIVNGNALVYDSVGFSAYLPGAPAPQRPSLADNFCEGPCLLPVGDMSTTAACTNPTGLFPVVAAPPACYGQAGQYELLRRQTVFTDGVGTAHQDTNNNPADYLLVAPNGGTNMGLSLTGVSGVTSVHGAAAPKNSSAPADMTLNQQPFDGPGTNQLGPRNAERNYNLDPQIANPANDPLGTFLLRLRFTTGGTPISGLRFSVENLSTLCGSQSALVTGTASARNLAAAPDCGTGLFTAILKVVNSTQEDVVDSSNSARLVFGTVLQDLSASATPTPPGSGPLSPFGGGVDSMLVLNPFATPTSVGDGVTGGSSGGFPPVIPANFTIRVRFKFGVVRSGRFILLVQPMASPSP